MFTFVLQNSKKRLRCITICNTKKSFKINELLVEQLRNTEFRITKFLILLSRQIEHFLQFCLDYLFNDRDAEILEEIK